MSCAALLKSIHQVMKAEDVLHGTELSCDLVPVPREIASDCGMAVVIECDQIDEVKELLRNAQIEILALFRVKESNYEVIFDKREKKE